jgi:hypothetical protein
MLLQELGGIHPSLEEQDIGNLMDKVGALMSKSEQGATASLSQQIGICIGIANFAKIFEFSVCRALSI